MWSSRPVWWAAFWLFLALPHAHAQAPDEAKEKAKAAFGRGKQAYDAGQYPTAVAAFEEAYALKPLPLLLLNIGLALEAMNNLPAAVTAYERFSATNPPNKAEIDGKVATLKKKMDAEWATVDVTTDPPGASIWVDKKEGAPRGQSNGSLRVPAGAVVLILEKDGFQAVQRPLKLVGGKTQSLGVALPQLLPMLSVKSIPSEAEVVVDGTVVGKTPLTAPFPAGPHRVEARLPGFAAPPQNIELNSSHTGAVPYQLELKLEKAVGQGQLAVFIDRPGAQVFVDGSPVGTAPIDRPLDLPEGTHKLEVRGGSTPYEEVVTIVPGEVTRTRIEVGVAPIEGDSGFGRREWSYVALGTGAVLLIGGGVTGVLALGADSDLSDCHSDPGCKGTNKEVGFADDVRSNALMTDILVGAGLAAAGVGAWLFFTSDGDDPTATADRRTFGVVPTDGGAAAFGRMNF